MKKIVLFAALILAALTAPAAAQSNCPYIAYGVTLTAGQWNACFASKQDVATASVPGGINSSVQYNKSGTLAGATGALSNGVGISFAASPTIGALNVIPGTAPATPNNGDLWETASGVFARVNGSTVGPMIGLGALYTAVPSIAALEALGSPSAVGHASVQSYYAGEPLGAGGGLFDYVASAISTDGVVYFPASDGNTWERETNGHSVSVLDAGAYGNALEFTDGAMSSSVSPTHLTSSMTTFVNAAAPAGDIGKAVIVQGAGSAGGSLTATISSYVSAHVVALSSPALTTVSGAFGAYGNDDATAFANSATAALSGLNFCIPASPVGAKGYYISTGFTLGNGASASSGLCQGNNAATGYVLCAATAACFTQNGSGINPDLSGLQILAINQASTVYGAFFENSTQRWTTHNLVVYAAGTGSNGVGIGFKKTFEGSFYDTYVRNFADDIHLYPDSSGFGVNLIRFYSPEIIQDPGLTLTPATCAVNMDSGNGDYLIHPHFNVAESTRALCIGGATLTSANAAPTDDGSLYGEYEGSYVNLVDVGTGSFDSSARYPRFINMEHNYTTGTVSGTIYNFVKTQGFTVTQDTWPTVTGTAYACDSASDGGNIIYGTGPSVSGTCSATGTAIIAHGTIISGLVNNCSGIQILSGGSATVTTACVNPSRPVFCYDLTSGSNGITCAVSGGSIAMTGTGTDHISWQQT